MITTYAGMTVSAGVITNLSDGGSSGTGGSGAEGDWGSFTDSATVYRIYPIKIPDVSAYNSITSKLSNGDKVRGDTHWRFTANIFWWFIKWRPFCFRLNSLLRQLL